MNFGSIAKQIDIFIGCMVIFDSSIFLSLYFKTDLLG